VRVSILLRLTAAFWRARGCCVPPSVRIFPSVCSQHCVGDKRCLKSNRAAQTLLGRGEGSRAAGAARRCLVNSLVWGRESLFCLFLRSAYPAVLEHAALLFSVAGRLGVPAARRASLPSPPAWHRHGAAAGLGAPGTRLSRDSADPLPPAGHPEPSARRNSRQRGRKINIPALRICCLIFRIYCIMGIMNIQEQELA